MYIPCSAGEACFAEGLRAPSCAVSWEGVREQQEREILQWPCLIMKWLIRFANTMRLVKLKLYVNLYTYVYLYLVYICVYLYLSVHESKVGDGVKFRGYY